MKFLEYWEVFDGLLEISIEKDFKDSVDYTELFKRLITSGEEESIDWDFNHFETFELLLNNKLKGKDLIEEKNLIQAEQEKILDRLSYDGGSFQTIIFNDLFFDWIDTKMVDNVKLQQYKKLQYLKGKLDRIDAAANDPNNFDADDPKFDSIAKKIIALYKLGILDHLDNNNKLVVSTNAKARIVSLITGDNVTTIQSALNAMVKGNIGKNNPLNSTKSCNEVDVILNKIGAKIIKE
ncbi:hypothetical protein [Empedobacter sedimenti]|uniref:hypothetical protein n=1 Tax=Empedobacter sedimenti TaxID=3042610 RepID=UPI0024A6CD17|nr:hypothetical protein [Empedobacter sedimenti]